MVSSSPAINKVLQQDIEEIAKRKLSFGDDRTPGELYGYAMNMKGQLDSLAKNNQRTPKELCALYRRLVLTSRAQVIPALRAAKFDRFVESLEKQLVAADKSYLEFLVKLSTQQNTSSIPGLS